MIDIDNEIKLAMKGGLSARLSVLRALKTSITTLLSTKGRTPGLALQPEEEQALIRSTMKKHDASIEAYRAAGRFESVTFELAERGILESLLPVQLTDDELDRIIIAGIQGSGATLKKEVQMVVGSIDIEQYAGRFDPKVLRRKIAEKLA